jgi:HD superfamily phosphohydrolase
MGGKERLIREPIHGYIQPTPQEIQVIDTPEFQRLRGIRQLANTSLVFPGATHTRFEHCLGVMEVASRMVDRLSSLRDDAEAKRRIRLAALLHDLGHGPFSHVSEDIVSRITGDGKFSNVSIAVDAVRTRPDLQSVLQSDAEDVASILTREEGQRLEYDIIDGQIDADKLDYLQRDSHYCGVPYGLPDILRVLYTIREIQHGEETYLGVSEKGIETVEALSLSRYHMHRIVYNHKTRRIADAMLVRATTLAVEDGALDRNYFDYRPADDEFLDMYFSLDDRSLMRHLMECGGTPGEIIRRLRTRRLLKVAYRMDLEELPGPTRFEVNTMDRSQTERMEQQISEDAGVDQDYVILDRQSIDNPTYRDPMGAGPTTDKLLVHTDTGLRYLDEMPGIWSAERKHAVSRLWVYSRYEDQDKIRRAAEDVISNL